MKLTDQALFRFLGWNTQGDLGPFTFYTSRRKGLVFFPRAPPTCPATPSQQLQRDKWAAAAAAWSTEDLETRATWELASKRAHLRITGLNLFMYHQLTADDAGVRTIEHQTGLTLLA